MQQELLAQIAALPADWHGAGTVSNGVLRSLVRHAPQPLAHSAETGTGRSTLLFSHLSQHHLVFAQDDRGGGDSLYQVTSSPLLHGETVTFVTGPTQLTLPRYELPEMLDLVLIDGPHAYPFPELEYYCFYPHIRPGGLLVVDDINIPSIHSMHRFLCKDDMWRLSAVVGHTSFFTRTSAPTFGPLGDAWWLQGYNRPSRVTKLVQHAKAHTPAPVKSLWHAVRRRD